jgi:hypothetical protein
MVPVFHYVDNSKSGMANIVPVSKVQQDMVYVFNAQLDRKLIVSVLLAFVQTQAKYFN